MRVLIDSPVWVGFLRGQKAARAFVDTLLKDGRAAITGPIYAEVLSGLKSPNDFQSLSILFRSLQWVDPPEDCWARVAQTRFTLARTGVDAHLIDLLIAHTAAHNMCEVLSADRDFERIARVLPFVFTLVVAT